MRTKLMTVAMSMALLGTISCSKTDLYDESKIAEREAAEEAAKNAELIQNYKDHFVKTFGEVSADQSWELGKDVTFIFNSEASSARTRAGITYEKKVSDKYEIESATLALMKREFVEGVDNSMSGTFFSMKTPGNSFTILPIFMGQSGGKFELYLHVDGLAEDILVWKKWDNMECKFAGKNNWTTLTESNNNGGKNTVGATAIRSKAITIEGLPENLDMYFYLKITKAAPGYNEVDDVMSSVNGMIKEYKFTNEDVKPTALPGFDAEKNFECKLIGCEDASTSKTDKDFNDVVFLLYGQPYVPQSFKIKKLTQEVTKRYMVEDLGDAYDKDFNDVVVDVITTDTATIKTDDNDVPLPGYENPEYKQESCKANVRALGGIYDIELTIGDKTWRKSKDKNIADYTQMINTTSPSNSMAPIATIENIKGYTPKTNDISVKVYRDADSPMINQVNFAQTGSIPMMIATDTKTLWSVEKKAFPFEQYMNK